MHISLQAELLGHIFGLPVTNSLVLAVSVGILLVIGFLVLSRRFSDIPGKLQAAGELVIEALLGFMEQILGDRRQALRFFPFIASIFLFILLNNWIGILPGVGSIGLNEMDHGKEVLVPFLRSANSDLNTTLALALVSVLLIQYYGIRKSGLWTHLGKYFPLRKGPIQMFVGLLELVEEFAKVLSFSFRLFGNIFAGEVLLMITMTLIPVLLPLPFLFLELFVGLIQALVFTMLSLIFLKVALETAHH